MVGRFFFPEYPYPQNGRNSEKNKWVDVQNIKVKHPFFVQVKKDKVKEVDECDGRKVNDQISGGLCLVHGKKVEQAINGIEGDDDKKQQGQDQDSFNSIITDVQKRIINRAEGSDNKPGYDSERQKRKQAKKE
jgi:hypothetical protein